MISWNKRNVYVIIISHTEQCRSYVSIRIRKWAASRKEASSILQNIYRDIPKYWDRQVWANSVDPDQMLKNAVSDQDPHCLQLVQQILDALTGYSMDLFKF